MNELQTRILEAALPHIVFEGWVWAAFERAAVDVGLSAFDAKRAFPGGVAEVLALFSARSDAAMCEALAQNSAFPSMKIRTRIAAAVMTRLQLLAPYREAVRRANGFYAMPWHSAAGLKALYATVDAMWRAAGDTSTDYNFYTKRLMLAGVYKSTLGVWLEDTSEDLAETRAFLDRRIENVMQIEKGKARLREQWARWFVA